MSLGPGRGPPSRRSSREVEEKPKKRRSAVAAQGSPADWRVRNLSPHRLGAPTGKRITFLDRGRRPPSVSTRGVRSPCDIPLPRAGPTHNTLYRLLCPRGSTQGMTIKQFTFFDERSLRAAVNNPG